MNNRVLLRNVSKKRIYFFFLCIQTEISGRIHQKMFRKVISRVSMGVWEFGFHFPTL